MSVLGIGMNGEQLHTKIDAAQRVMAATLGKEEY